MKVQLFSDVHFEFHADRGRAFVDALDPTDVDVLVVAGDLASSECLVRGLDLLCKRYPQVVFVTGNHSFYGSSPSAVRQLWLDAGRKHKNLHWLDDDAVTIDGVRFVGGTLWFAESEDSKRLQRHMNDFRAIGGGFDRWVYRKNLETRKYFADSLREGDVLVCHHLPSFKSVAPQYVGDPLNVFFVCDIEPLIAERKPQLVLHGHTHGSCDYKIGETRVVCNPYGYQGYEINKSFVEKLVIDVEAKK